MKVALSHNNSLQFIEIYHFYSLLSIIGYQIQAISMAIFNVQQWPSTKSVEFSINYHFFNIRMSQFYCFLPDRICQLSGCFHFHSGLFIWDFFTIISFSSHRHSRCRFINKINVNVFEHFDWQTVIEYMKQIYYITLPEFFSKDSKLTCSTSVPRVPFMFLSLFIILLAFCQLYFNK